MNLGEHLHKLRRQQNKTLAVLAKESGVSISMISRIENGVVHPSAKTLSGIVAALDAEIITDNDARTTGWQLGTTHLEPLDHKIERTEDDLPTARRVAEVTNPVDVARFVYEVGLKLAEDAEVQPDALNHASIAFGSVLQEAFLSTETGRNLILESCLRLASVHRTVDVLLPAEALDPRWTSPAWLDFARLFEEVSNVQIWSETVSGFANLVTSDNYALIFGESASGLIMTSMTGQSAEFFARDAQQRTVRATRIMHGGRFSGRRIDHRFTNAIQAIGDFEKRPGDLDLLQYYVSDVHLSSALYQKRLESISPGSPHTAAAVAAHSARRKHFEEMVGRVRVRHLMSQQAFFSFCEDGRMEGDPDHVFFSALEVVQVLTGLIELIESRGKFELGFTEHQLGATVFEISRSTERGAATSVAIERPLRNHAGVHLFVADATVAQQYEDYFERHWSRATPDRDKVLEHIRTERTDLKRSVQIADFSWSEND